MSRVKANSRKGTDGFTTVQRRSDGPKAAWTCKSCVGRGGGPWRNNGSLGTCSKCKVAKGACFGAKVADACPTVRAPGPAGPATSLDTATMGKKERQEMDALRNENKQLKASLAQTAGQPAHAEDATADGPKDQEQRAVEAELAKARDALKSIEGTPEIMRPFLRTSYDQLVAEQKTVVQTLDAKRRGLKPVDDQLKQTRVHLKSMQDRHDKDVKAAQASEKAIAELQASLAEQQIKAAASLAEVERVKAEVAQLSASVAEACGAGTQAASPLPTPGLFTGAHLHALQQVLQQVDPASLGEQAQEKGTLINDVLAALRKCAAHAEPSEEDFADAEEVSNMELDLSEEEIIALSSNGFAEGANFATANAEDQATLKKKAIGFCKGELKASTDKRKTLRVVKGIAAKARRTKSH